MCKHIPICLSKAMHTYIFPSNKKSVSCTSNRVDSIPSRLKECLKSVSTDLQPIHTFIMESISVVYFLFVLFLLWILFFSACHFQSKCGTQNTIKSLPLCRELMMRPNFKCAKFRAYLPKYLKTMNRSYHAMRLYRRLYY